MPKRSLARLYRDEFKDYNREKFIQDLLAGLTVAAVALPLALAFGVASGATASAGLVTAILAGIIIGLLSGAPYQISGPTGAMSAILIILSGKYGTEGVWVAGVLSGVLLLLIGSFKLGRFIAFIPAPVITGFTSGIAIIIFVGQLDNFFGVKVSSSDSAFGKILDYLHTPFSPNFQAVLIAAVVIVCMLFWPANISRKFPGSLLGLIAASLISQLLKFDVKLIGDIPRSLLLDQRLHLSNVPWDHWRELIAPTLSITALGAIESLLCGAVASNITGIRLQANQELIGQGIGNILIPFFGGVPATAAIARTSVGIKSGGQTRLVSVIHALTLLASMFILAPIMSKIPLAALAGILMVTAWRMNDWEEIRYIFGCKFMSAILGFGITMIATASLDLTQAILIGTFLSGTIFVSQIAQLDVEIHNLDKEKLLERGIVPPKQCPHTKVAFLTGPLFFAAVGNFNEAFLNLGPLHCLILSFRGVPLIDTSGLLALESLVDRVKFEGGSIMLAGVHRGVKDMLARGGLLKKIGEENIHWSSDQAIAAATNNPCNYCTYSAELHSELR